MSGPTKAHLRQAREIGATLPRLVNSDIVIAELPDGTDLLVKGYTVLNSIIARDAARELQIMRVPVFELELAAALEQVLGNDGTFAHPGPVGTA